MMTIPTFPVRLVRVIFLLLIAIMYTRKKKNCFDKWEDC